MSIDPTNGPLSEMKKASQQIALSCEERYDVLWASDAGIWVPEDSRPRLKLEEKDPSPWGEFGPQDAGGISIHDVMHEVGRHSVRQPTVPALDTDPAILKIEPAA